MKLVKKIKQNIIPFKCDECGKWKFEKKRLKTNGYFGDVWCMKCYKEYKGITEETCSHCDIIYKKFKNKKE